MRWVAGGREEKGGRLEVNPRIRFQRASDSIATAALQRQTRMVVLTNTLKHNFSSISLSAVLFYKSA